MSNTFLIADTHFGHQGSCKWLDSSGNKIRPFENAEEMDEILVSNWNSVVGPKDKVYLLGDLSMKRSAIATVGRCNGEKVLVKGNHDIFKLSDYMPYFKDIRGSHKLDNFILTHIPIHPDSLERWDGNIHGHLHNGKVMTKKFTLNFDEYGRPFGSEDDVPDSRYFCVSVEQINYTPIPFETVKKIMKERVE